MPLTSAQLDRAVGSLLGAAAGDALGAGYEFGPPLPDTQPVHMAGGGTFAWAPGEWTDDTSMAVPVLQVLASGGSLDDDGALDRVVATWHAWARDAKDVGNQTRALMSALTEPTAAEARAVATARYALEPGRSGGNGSLMRTGPVALGYLDDGQEGAVARAARAVSDLTHADPDAGDACVLWSLAVRHAIRTGGLDLLAGLAHLPAERRERWAGLVAAGEAAQPRAFTRNGWVVEAFQAAWSAIHHGTGLVDTLERAVRGGRDADTVASIAGALAGAVAGAGAVPQRWRDVLHGWPGLRADDLEALVTRAVDAVNAVGPDAATGDDAVAGGLVATARRLATAAHAGQVDKAGAPYIGHPARVAGHAAAAGGDERVVAAAWLHDVVEDTDVTPDDLRAAGIPEDVVGAVVALSKVPGEPAQTYFTRVNRDPLAVVVKVADLQDNTDPQRLALLDDDTRAHLVAKYARSRALLADPLA